MWFFAWFHNYVWVYWYTWVVFKVSSTCIISYQLALRSHHFPYIRLSRPIGSLKLIRPFWLRRERLLMCHENSILSILDKEFDLKGQQNIVKLHTPSSFLNSREFLSYKELVMTLRLRLSFFENHNMFLHGPWVLFCLMQGVEAWGWHVKHTIWVLYIGAFPTLSWMMVQLGFKFPMLSPHGFLHLAILHPPVHLFLHTFDTFLKFVKYFLLYNYRRMFENILIQEGMTAMVEHHNTTCDQMDLCCSFHGL